MNIASNHERAHKMRFLDRDKLKQVNRANDERRERNGKTKISLHEHYNTDALPDASDLKAWVDEFHDEHNQEPNSLLWPYFTKSKKVIVFSNRLQKCVTIDITRSEFLGLERRAD